MKYELDEVFGVSNKMVETYIYREEIDERFIHALSSDKHIIIYGASKQGKTYLYKRHIADKEYIVVECSPASDTVDIYRSILRQVGATSSTATTLSSQESITFDTGLNVKIKIPLIGEMGSKFGAGTGDTSVKTISYNTYEYNLSLAQDVSEALKCIKFSQRIIIENFHYLNEEVQRKFAFDLRTFHGSEIKFVILGIWKEKNRILQFNGDLVDRIHEIPVEPWGYGDFHKIITKGEELLNIDFSPIRDAIISDTFGSVGVLQELCKESCLSADVKRTCATKTAINDKNYLDAIILKVEHYSGRHFRSFEVFINQPRRNENQHLFIPYYFLQILTSLDFIEIQKGLKRNTIQDKIKEIHHNPEGICSSAISHFLHNIVKYQIKKGINPPMFDYDLSNRTLRIIDSTLFFYLRYFRRDNIIEHLTIPQIT